VRFIGPQDLNGRRGEENLAEVMHPVAGLILGARTSMAKFLKLIEAG
jgi:hypothetical protein